jgi:predicted polyphosphate/ATP-dependent NAD kinase
MVAFSSVTVYLNYISMSPRKAVGIVANPLSGRDIRRLVAHAHVVRAAEKASMIICVLRALKAAGVDLVLCSVDLGGVSAGVARAISHDDGGWPEVRFLSDMPPTDTADDTRQAVRAMVQAGVGCVICMGGDGTARVAAQVCGDVPLLALSTGTNNAFPQTCEPTGAGLAAALVAKGAVPVDDADPKRSEQGGSGPNSAVYRCKLLEVEVDGHLETALVDVAVIDARQVGSRAVWNPLSVRELYCAFAEPHAVGLSAVLGQLSPCTRRSPVGVMAQMSSGRDAAMSVLVAVAPGLLTKMSVEQVRTLVPGAWWQSDVDGGVVCLDGERELPFAGSRPRIRLLRGGPICVDVQAVLALAAQGGLLRSSTPLSRSVSAERSRSQLRGGPPVQEPADRGKVVNDKEKEMVPITS